MLLLQVDVTANTAEHKALLKRFRCSARRESRQALLKRFSLFGPPGSSSSTRRAARSRACA